MARIDEQERLEAELWEQAEGRPSEKSSIDEISRGATGATKFREVPVLPSDRRQIVSSVEIDVLRDDLIYELRQHPRVFQVGGRLVTVVRPTRHDDGGHFIDEPPEIRRMNRATLLPAATGVVNFVRARKDRKTGETIFVPCTPPGDLLNAVLEAGEYPGIRQLVGISETPVIAPDGSFSMEEGYDPHTGVYFAPNASYLRWPERPTREHAAEAYASLVEPFAEFPFEEPDLGKAVIAAAILSVIGRNAVRGPVPAFLTQKNVRGCGGTLVSDAISIIATGRNAGRMTMPPEEEELEKVMSAFAIKGTPLVTFDNAIRLGGGPFDKCITAQDTVDLRVLGQSRIETLPWRAVVVVNGNNVEIAGDTTRRVLVATLASELERPELRTGYKHPDLRAYLMGRRVELVRDCCIILDAWFTAGREGADHGCLGGGFEDWSRTIAGAIVYAGGASPIGAYAEAVGVVDAERHAQDALLDGWERLGGSGGITVKSALSTLYPPPRRDEAPPPDGFDELREAIEVLAPPVAGRVNAKTLGKVIARMRKRVIGGRMFDGTTAKGGTLRWSVVKAKGGLGGLGGFNPIPRAREEQENKYPDTGGKQPTDPTQPTLNGASPFTQDMAEMGIGGAE